MSSNPEMSSEQIKPVALTIENKTSIPEEDLRRAAEITILNISGDMPMSFAGLEKFINLETIFFRIPLSEGIPDLSACEHLTMAGFKSCQLTEISVDSLPSNLHALTLTDNKLSELTGIERLTELKKLMLSGNNLTSLPGGILACKELQLLRLSANQLDSSLVELLSRLPKLAWLVDAGNPSSYEVEGLNLSDMEEIEWADLHVNMDDKVGKSAMNAVYSGRYEDSPVAVKMYGGQISTDGRPSDEIMACILAGNHPNIVSTIGLTSFEGQIGLVMPLIDQDRFKILAKAPDFKTLTRDVYPEGKTFDLSFVMNVIKGVAAGMTHLHELGIMHGDLYAHNLFVDSEGNVLIGDFGAASLYEPGSEEGRLREKMDVRAFGYLIEELRDRFVKVEGENTVAKVLLDMLLEDCLSEELDERPSFAKIVEELSSMH